MPRDDVQPVRGELANFSRSTVDEVLHALEICPAAVDDRFVLAAANGAGYFSREGNARICLLIPVVQREHVLGRQIGGLAIDYAPKVRFDYAGQCWDSPALMLTCLDPILDRTFCSLSLDVCGRLALEPVPTVPRVLAQLSEWERLLRLRRRLTSEEELGLWGELWTIANFADRFTPIWTGPSGAAADFTSGDWSLEVKTTMRRLQFQVSQQQLEGPNAATHILALWATLDPNGISVSELVDRIDKSLSDGADFERKLLSIGYARTDADFYRQRFSLTESPYLFRSTTIPRIRSFDRGVSSIRFAVSVDEDEALPSEKLELLLTRCSMDAPT